MLLYKHNTFPYSQELPSPNINSAETENHDLEVARLLLTAFAMQEPCLRIISIKDTDCFG